jgi:hypothetical protein
VVHRALALSFLAACASRPPAPPPPVVVEPTRPGCLTHAAVAEMVEGMHGRMAPREDLRLLSATCRKRAYGAGDARFVVWEHRGGLRGKSSSDATPPPSAACIERGLALLAELAPFAEGILRRERAEDPELWRDPDVGLVSYIECEGGRPEIDSLATLLHETLHRVSDAGCTYDYRADRHLCLERDPALPGGAVALYPAAPATLDAFAAKDLLRVQRLYLVETGHDLAHLLDEVMAYRVAAELHAAAARRRLFPPGVTHTNNLSIMMALATRYLLAVADRHPALARHPTVVRVLDEGEATYALWRAAVSSSSNLETVMFEEYRKNRVTLAAAGRSGDRPRTAAPTAPRARPRAAPPAARDRGRTAPRRRGR